MTLLLRFVFLGFIFCTASNFAACMEEEVEFFHKMRTEVTKKLRALRDTIISWEKFGISEKSQDKYIRKMGNFYGLCQTNGLLKNLFEIHFSDWIPTLTAKKGYEVVFDFVVDAEKAKVLAMLSEPDLSLGK
jgi:hypothetical protein